MNVHPLFHSTRAQRWKSVALGALALLTTLPAHAAWTVSADPAAMRPLRSQWQQYFGLHYGTAAGYDGPWFKTVRSYGAPNMGLPRTTDGTLNTAALTGTPMTGPFLGQTYAVSPRDIRNSNTNGPALDTLIPDLLANGLTTIYPTPNLFFPPQPVNQDLAYVTLRSVYAAFPDAATKVIWQWGNEVNGKNWNPALTDTLANQASQVPFYAEAYFARGIEALYRVSRDLYGDSQRIPVMSGSFANIYNVNYRNWMRSVLNYRVTGTSAPTLAGTSIWQHVDILTVHYPFSAGEGGGAVMQEMWDEWIASGKIPALWVTEDHGQQGAGPSTILARSMRYLGWIATNNATADQTRLCWWGTEDNDDPGGQASQAINQLGRLLAGSAIRQSTTTIDGAEIYLVANADATSLTRLTLAIIPPGAEESGGPAITPVDPGTITLTLPAGSLSTVGAATGVQYSRDQRAQTWTPAVSVVGQNLQITVGRTISSPMLISIPLTATTPPSVTPGDSRLVNLSILSALAPGETMTMGAVIGGAGASGAKPLLARAAGPSLAQFGATELLPDPKLSLVASTGSTVVASNNDWGANASALTAAFTQTGAFAFLSPASRDAAIFAPQLPAGNYTVLVSDNATGAGTVIAELYDATPSASFTATTPRLTNVSVLKQLGTGLTAGFVVGGTGSKTLLVRAIGPTLGAAPFNVAGVVSDPQLTLYSGQTAIGANDNWGGAAVLTAAFGQVGAFALPAASRDAALLATVQPGSYTVVARGVGGQTGVALIELYEVP